MFQHTCWSSEWLVTSQLLSSVKLEAFIKGKKWLESHSQIQTNEDFFSNRNFLSYDKQTIWKLAIHDEDQHTIVIMIDIGSIWWS